MKRWNGWGDTEIGYPLPAIASVYLRKELGALQPPIDASLEQVLNSVPFSRLPDHPLVDKEPHLRLTHACGQSLQDWVHLRSGGIPAFPDGVSQPESSAQVQALLEYSQKTGTTVVPYGGGTSVVGHINPNPGSQPVLTIDLKKMNRLISLDETSHLASFEAGVAGPALENQLNERGFTLGHYPQSFDYSTLGGWIATRSSGQQSYYYGRIEDLFAGGSLETFHGTVSLPALPASAAGPDLRQMILGSEGRFGILTSATVRVRPIPEFEAFYGVFFRDWDSGAETVREIAQSTIPVSMLRLSDSQETETTLVLSGKERLVSWADRGLRLLGHAQGRCLLIYGTTGDLKQTHEIHRQVSALCKTHHGLSTGRLIGDLWRKGRFRTPYLRNSLWEHGVAIDTLETALPWNKVNRCAEEIKSAIRTAMSKFDENVLVFSHLSHIYPDGASIYVTFLFRTVPDPDQLIERWKAMKTAASEVIVRQQGTISHQHGVGVDHAAYLAAEKSEVGMQMIKALSQTLDPKGLFNPGKLFKDA